MVRVWNPKEPDGLEQQKEVNFREIKASEREEKDIFLYPPPVECTWSHMARYFNLGGRSEACRQLALKWAKILGIFAEEDEAEASVKTMWALSTRSATEGYRYLRKTERQLQKIRCCRDYEMRSMRNSSVEKKFKFSVAAQLAEDDFVLHAVMVWSDVQKTRQLKCLCAKCGMIMVQKCKQCSMCSVRYCSRECQRGDWAAHKGTCSGRKVIDILGPVSNNDSDDDSEQ